MSAAALDYSGAHFTRCSLVMVVGSCLYRVSTKCKWITCSSVVLIGATASQGL